MAWQSSLILRQTRAVLRPLPSSTPAPCTLLEGLHDTRQPLPQRPVENSPALAAPWLPWGLFPFRPLLSSHAFKGLSGLWVGRQLGLLREEASREGGRAGREGRQHGTHRLPRSRGLQAAQAAHHRPWHSPQLHIKADNKNCSVKLPDFYFCLSKLLAPSLIIGIYYWAHLLPL